MLNSSSNGPAPRAVSRPADPPQLSNSEFERIAERVHATTGIVLQDHKRVLVRSRISKRLRELGLNSFDAYLNYLETPEGENETIAFCNAITTNLTSFFREMHHFEHMRDNLEHMPLKENSRLRIWSAGCSSGEEPYSIAMTLLSCPAAMRVKDTKILATDIDTRVLEKGRGATYRSKTAEDIPPVYRRFLTPDETENHVTVAQEAQDMIAFKRLNLFSKWPLTGRFDFIFCRNVMIYFSAENKSQLVENFVQYLKPNGFLYLGHSESIMQAHPNLVPEGRTTFRRV